MSPSEATARVMQSTVPSSEAASNGCPACRDNRSTGLFDKEARNYLRCQGCGLVYSLPRPDEVWLTGLYDDIGQRYFTNPEMLAYYFAPHRFERELRFISKHLQPDTRMLDVGCCVGAFVHAAQAAGYRASGIDISPAAVECGRQRGLDLRVEDLLTTDYPTPFDSVCMWAT